MSDFARYGQMFEYLRTPEYPEAEAPVLAFGRKDPLVAEKVGTLASASLAEIIVISGGIGKDSGNLQELGYRSEADYLGQELEALAAENGIELPEIILEEEATNGGENARFGLKIITGKRPAATALTMVAHATSVRRLAAATQSEAEKAGYGITTYNRLPTDYAFDPNNDIDRAEARAELLRLADWPAKGWSVEQPDLPDDLVDFARDVTEQLQAQ